MRQEPLHLDYNSTTPVRPAVRETMLPFFGPSLAHAYGHRLRSAMGGAWVELARLTAADAGEIAPVNCGSQANYLASSIRRGLWGRQPN